MSVNRKKYLYFCILCLLFISNLQANEKAELKANDFTSENVLHDAVRANDFQMVEYLVNQGVSINKQDEYGYTPLHLAVRLHQFDISSFLIANQANVNTIDEYEDTPLIDATRNNDTQIAKLLICNGANRNVVDANGMTTLQNSAKSKNQEIVNLLRVDNLAPYCQKEIRITMDPFTISPNNYYDKNICGDILTGFVVSVGVEFKDEDDEVFGPFAAEFSNETKRWCLNTETTTLQDDIYEVKAIAKDHVINDDYDINLRYIYAQKLDLAFDSEETTTYPYPRICGTTNSDAIDVVTLFVSDTQGKEIGSYEALIDDKKKTWCADVSDKLEHGYYNLKVNGKDLYDQVNSATKENFFVDTADFEITIFNLKEVNSLPTDICGISNKKNLQSVDIQFIDENMITYKLPSAVIDNENQSWCSSLVTLPPKGIYTIKAIGTSTKKEISIDQYESYDLGNMIQKKHPKISINEYPQAVGKKPKICGTIEDGNIVKGDIFVEDSNGIGKGTYKLELDPKNKRWCSQISQVLENGIYTVKVNAINSKKILAQAETTFEVYTIPELYTLLREEFQDDMEAWDATLDPESLVFSFRDPDGLFKRGSSELNVKFESILADFFPRYVKITAAYKQYIKNIVIEGHSSSENRMGRTAQERFELNEILSINRARNVLAYTSTLVSSDIGENILWLISTFKSNGLSSSNLIYNEDGTENKEMSRRVEFHIQNKRILSQDKGE